MNAAAGTGDGNNNGGRKRKEAYKPIYAPDCDEEQKKPGSGFVLADQQLALIMCGEGKVLKKNGNVRCCDTKEKKRRRRRRRAHRMK